MPRFVPGFCFYLAAVSRYHSYLNSAREILALYRGEEPFASFIKKYFGKHKESGSRDRKEINNLCYSCFRMGKEFVNLQTDEKILSALFLCSTEPNALLENIKPEWNEKTGLSINEKLSSLSYQLSSFFPWKEELSDGIDYEKFGESFFIQPDLFLRIRPGYAGKVLLKLNEAGVNYEFISPFTIRLPISFKADKYFDLDKEVVVQDYNSQQIAGFIPVRSGRSDRVWDCCAGSGGKSIMVYDLNPGISVVVSDVRESILANLKKRFERAGIRKYKSLILDLSNENTQHSPKVTKDSFGESLRTIINNPRLPVGQEFSIIIADVPCTGSGVWGRTPEQLAYFDSRKIGGYASMQKRIISNAIPHLRPGGYFLYITCSVFKKENEEVVSYLKEKFHLQLLKMELLKGYQLKADTMFVALLQKPL